MRVKKFKLYYLFILTYSIVVSSCGGGSGGTESPSTGQPTTPNIIINLTAQPLSPGNIELEWNSAGPNRLYWVFLNDCLYAQVLDLRAIASRLNPQTRYCFRVVAYTSYSPYIYIGESAEICISTPADITPPESPAYISAVSDLTQISLGWPEALDDAWVERYRLYRNGAYLRDTTDLTLTDTTADAGTIYCYQVSALDKAGNESPKSYKICASRAWTTSLDDVGFSLGTILNDTSLALDASGRPHMVYFKGPNLIYATRGSEDWVKTNIDTDTNPAGQVSLVLDSSGKVHISYSTDGEYSLKYATNASGDWVIYTVDGNWVGLYSSIAVDASGKVHISYYDYQNGKLKYATNASGSWITTVIDDSYYVGKYTSIAVEPSGTAHICYFDAHNEILKYATNAGGSWTTAILDNTGKVGIGTSIAVDILSNVHIGYYDDTNRSLKYATNQSGDWAASVVHTGTPSGTGWIGSLTLDASGKVHMSYNDWGYGILRYATNSSGSWKNFLIAPDTIGASPVSNGASAVRIDTSGNVHFSSQQGTRIVYSIYNFN